MKIRLTALLCAGMALALSPVMHGASPGQDGGVFHYVDPMIGSKGEGGVHIGPSAPFGMIKPGPDCSRGRGNGWLDRPHKVFGFSQIHMSGTGGGPKYGNILLQPFSGGLDKTWHEQERTSETVEPGYYSCSYEDEGIVTEISVLERSALYRFTYPGKGGSCLSVDCGFHLGNNGTGFPKEEQYFIGSEVHILSDREVEGYSRVRGGWNNGGPYTVYFYLCADKPFAQTRTWKGENISTAPWQADTGDKTGALLSFADSPGTVNVRLGISNLSCLKARQNVEEQIGDKDLPAVRSALEDRWNEVLGRVEIDAQAPDSLKRMFYTSLYHAYLHPIDKSGENPHWSDGEPYFDDYYALWDTFRTSLPLVFLLTPERGSDFVRSLLSTYRHDGYLPDGRSGHSNGRTQGGSNADIVLSDAYLKGIAGVDWELALKACLKDADVPPGGDEEAEGRGGLLEYNTLGYIPYGIGRAGTRTVEYARCDYSIYLLAKGLGYEDVASRFLAQSGNWRNLWRPDTEYDGARGFIMPRAADGRWLDKVWPLTWGTEEFEFTPVTREKKMTDNWHRFFYEGTSWHYSLSVPHDVPGLIEACGGPEAFRRRLDTFLYTGYFSVCNEPAFFAPCLYHWLGRPDLTSDIVRHTVYKEFNAGRKGLPGNDDTGATSAWLTFHLMGLYPVAGQDVYILHSPLVEEVTLHLDGGDFTVRSRGLSDKRRYIRSARLNGKAYPYSTLHHKDIASGGVLELEMGAKPSDWGRQLAP